MDRSRAARSPDRLCGSSRSTERRWRSSASTSIARRGVSIESTPTRLRATLEVVPRQFPEGGSRCRKPTSTDRRRLPASSGNSVCWRGSGTRQPRSHTGGERSCRPPTALGLEFGLRRFFNGEPRSPHRHRFSSTRGAPVRASNRGRVVLARGLLHRQHGGDRSGAACSPSTFTSPSSLSIRVRGWTADRRSARSA